MHVFNWTVYMDRYFNSPLNVCLKSTILINWTIFVRLVLEAGSIKLVHRLLYITTSRVLSANIQIHKVTTTADCYSLKLVGAYRTRQLGENCVSVYHCCTVLGTISIPRISWQGLTEDYSSCRRRRGYFNCDSKNLTGKRQILPWYCQVMVG